MKNNNFFLDTICHKTLDNSLKKKYHLLNAVLGLRQVCHGGVGWVIFEKLNVDSFWGYSSV